MLRRKEEERLGTSGGSYANKSNDRIGVELSF